MTLLLPSLLFSAAASAADYASETQDFLLEDSADVFSVAEFSTGFVPDGSPLQVEFSIQSTGGTSIRMEGSGDLTWPEALTLAITPKPGSGFLALDTTIDAVTTVRIDLSDLGYVGDFEIDRRGFGLDGNTFFEPFGMTGGAPDHVSLVDTLDGLSLIDFDYELFPGLSFSFVANLVPTANVDFHAKEWLVNEISYISDAASTASLPTEPVDYYPVSAVLTGDWTSSFDLVIDPTLEACVAVVGCLDIVSFEYPLTLAGGTFEQEFPSVDMDFPLPLMNLDEDSADLGEVEVGTERTLEFPIGNDGAIPFYGEVTIQGSGEFYVYPETFNALPGTEDGVVITFAPSIDGDQTATLVLTTNDPNNPLVEIPLTGAGYMPVVQDDDDTGADTGSDGLVTTDDGDSKEVSSCGCSSSAGRGMDAAGFGAAAGLLALTLIRRRAR